MPDAPREVYDAIARNARRGFAHPAHFRHADIFQPPPIQFAQRDQWQTEPKDRIHICDTGTIRLLCHTTDK
jgi:hypothetical protein